MTSFPVKMMSDQNEICCNSRFWVQLLNEKTDFDFRHLERPWSFIIEAIFSILRLKKIDQKDLELDIKKQFYIKSTPQNPMSYSVFPDYDVGRSFKLIFKITNASLNALELRLLVSRVSIPNYTVSAIVQHFFRLSL